MSSNPVVSQNPGFFSPINQTFSEKEDQQLIQLTSIQRDNARYINLREVAIYQTTEQQTGQQWFNPNNAQVARYGYRLIVTFGALGAGSMNTIPHNINGVKQFTFINGVGITTAGPFQVPLPYVSVAANANIDLKADTTNIYLNLGAAGFSLSSGFVILEYLKQSN